MYEDTIYRQTIDNQVLEVVKGRKKSYAIAISKCPKEELHLTYIGIAKKIEVGTDAKYKFVDDEGSVYYSKRLFGGLKTAPRKNERKKATAIVFRDREGLIGKKKIFMLQFAGNKNDKLEMSI